jgi:hypothetical protein
MCEELMDRAGKAQAVFARQLALLGMVMSVSRGLRWIVSLF